MLRVYPSNLRYSVDLGWLRSHLSFSFGEYFDENNTSFGVMRVCNDDFVAGGKGFGPHPHSDMEIVTVVLAGAIKHEDNLGHIEITSAGEVERRAERLSVSGGSGAAGQENLVLRQGWPCHVRCSRRAAHDCGRVPNRVRS